LPAWRPRSPRSPARFDEATGRDLASYPRQPQVDFLHMTLNILIPI
jgi:hypothetical protein